jgi:hypothetical protein
MRTPAPGLGMLYYRVAIFGHKERIVTQTSDRELIAGAANPLGMDGIEFVEFSTSKPQALGQVLEMIGFHPIARHRSREVLLYRQGDINVIVNAHAGGQARASPPSEIPTIAAFALRVRDAATAYRHAIDRGAWIVPSQVESTESATAATTASKYSTTTTSRCRSQRWQREPASRRFGWARTCSDEQCPCPTASAYAAARY